MAIMPQNIGNIISPVAINPAQAIKEVRASFFAFCFWIEDQVIGLIILVSVKPLAFFTGIRPTAPLPSLFKS